MLDRGLFLALQELPAGGKNEVITLLAGPKRGAKALLSDGKVLWQHGAGDFGQVKDSAALLIEPVPAERELIICGAGHVALAVIVLAKMVDFHITVIEDRPDYAEEASRAGADTVLVEGFEQALAKIPGGDNTYFVVLTREHQYDAICLKAILQKEFAYAGVMGSRRRTELLRQKLIAEGISAEVVARLHAPIGLDIGAETEREIAVAIVAELIKFGRRAGTFPKKLIAAALQAKEPFVLAAIIRRKGSAPRDVGTKMLIFAEHIVATIGGGVWETRIIRRGRQMLAGKETQDVWEQVDMRGDDAALGHMACGGIVEVLLEYVEPGKQR
ncbi:XdhC/CoxI family protein [Selenomonas ruminantium]|uniref:XdhC family protein n=1 Tax=Selenomonas ruminantium TaxID=971 RepID=UPI00156A16CA|nr:XdhC/CoxI family protein [Selenomonas ruminantium]